MPFKDKELDKIKHREYAKTYRKKHIDTINDKYKKYRATDKGRAMAAIYASRNDAKERGHVGIIATLEEVIRVIQTHKCSFCGKEEQPGMRRFHIDHCHITGRLRGLLCGKHNRMLTDIQEMKNLIAWAESCV